MICMACHSLLGSTEVTVVVLSLGRAFVVEHDNGYTFVGDEEGTILQASATR